MKILRYLYPLAVLMVPGLQGAGAAADADFEALKVLARPRPPSRGPQNAAQLDTDRRLQVASFVAAAEKAREFHEKNPAHEKVSEARKIEVESLFGAVRAGAAEHEGKAVRLAHEFRGNSRHPSRERYQVAALARGLEVRKQNHGESKGDVLAAYERVALDLYGEFPGEPAVYDLFLGVARNAEPTKAREVANRLLIMPAPPGVKDEARVILERLEMPGRPFVAEWSDVDGGGHAMGRYKGRTVVFYVWASWAGATETHARIKALVPPAAVLVSVNLDNDSAVGKAARTSAGIGGVEYHDARGLNAPLARQLRAHRVPGVYVVDRHGVFLGGGAPDDLAALLEAASKK